MRLLRGDKGIGGCKGEEIEVDGITNNRLADIIY